MTNFEKIKQMSVEEMAEWISDMMVDCGINMCPAAKTCSKRYTGCISTIETWFESEVEE